MTQVLNVALLGAGRIGQVHARTLKGLDIARAAAVSDAMPDAANALAAQTGAKVMNTDEIIADPGIDAVVIGTPTTTHYDLIHEAAAFLITTLLLSAKEVQGGCSSAVLWSHSEGVRGSDKEC